MPTKPTRPYQHTLPGPDLDRPFFVTSGMIAVIGMVYSVTLPTGATWPGIEALSNDLFEDLQPCESVTTRGAETREATESDVLAGLALVQAQVLRQGPITTQLARLERHEIGEVNHHTKAALLGRTRESVAKVDVQRPLNR